MLSKNMSTIKKYQILLMFFVMLFLFLTTIISLTNAQYINNQLDESTLVYTDINFRDLENISIYAIIQDKPLDLQLRNLLEQKNISVSYFTAFNSSIAKDYTATLINFNWLYSQKGTVIQDMEKFIFSGSLIIFYGDYLSNFYKIINATRIKNMFAVYPIPSNGTIVPYMPEDIIAFGVSVLDIPSNESIRYPTGQFYLTGDINVDDIALSIIEWAITYKEYMLQLTKSVNVTEGYLKEPHVANIYPEGWDYYCGYIGWKYTTLKYGSINAARIEIRVDYWYEEDDTRPNQWSYHLVNPKHVSKPLQGYIAPFKSISKVDCDSDNEPGEQIYDWGPENWGGPTNKISFSLSAGLNGPTASISYEFGSNSLSWRDLSDPAFGIHEVEHTYTSWPFVPYGSTAKIEPSTIFMNDNAKTGGSLPLTLTHYYWSQFGVQWGGTFSGSISFSVAVHSTTVYET